MAIAVPTTANDFAVVGPGNSSSRVVTKPSNVADNDILIACLAHEANRAITPPSGWTQIAAGNSNSQIWQTSYYKRASSEGASWTWGFDAIMWSEILVFRVTGCLTSGSPLDGTATTNPTTGTTAASWTSLTTTSNNSAAFALGASFDDGQNWGTWTNSFTEIYDNSKTGAAWKAIPTAGAVGSVGATLSISTSHEAILFALKDAAAGATTKAPPPPFRPQRTTYRTRRF